MTSCDERKYMILPSNIGRLDGLAETTIMIYTNPRRKLVFGDIMNDSFQFLATTYSYAEGLTPTNEIPVLKHLWSKYGSSDFPFAQQQILSFIGLADMAHFDSPSQILTELKMDEENTWRQICRFLSSDKV